MNDVVPRATVAIPAHDAIATIGECLRSLEAQTAPREQFEIVVADNGSTDGTVAFIAREFPRVRVVHAREPGSGYARNAAIAAARGAYILSTDADCVVDPAWVATMIAALDARPEIAVFGGAIRPYRERTIVERYRRTWIRQANLAEGGGAFRYAETPNAAYRASVFAQVGPFDGTVFDDSDLGLRIDRAGLRTAYLPEAIVAHRNPSTLRRLYRQRFTYGKFDVAFARKHPDLRPDGASNDPRAGRYRTARRVARDLLLLPAALIGGAAKRREGTRFAPIIDAVVAIAFQRGRETALKGSFHRDRPG